MSIFTTELRYPIEQYQDDNGLDRRTYDAGVYKLIGLDEYPIFEESYRAKLNNKIIEHYYFKEIGTDTLGRFRWYMRTTMNEIMPYFNALYEAQNSITDPLTNRNLSWHEVWELAETGGSTTDKEGGTTYGRKDVTSTDGTTGYGRRDVVSTEGETDYGRTEHRANGGKDTQLAGTTKDKVIHSETPMNELQTNAVENGNYATDVTFTTHEGQRAGETVYGGTTDVTNGGKDTTTSTRTSQASGADTSTSDSTSQASGRDTTDSEERYTRALDTDGTKTHTDVGYDGTTPTALLAELADKFVNIDVQIIERLAPLFMGLWE